MIKTDINSKSFQGLAEGLHICSYGNGDEFRSASSLFHFNINENDNNSNLNNNDFIDNDIILDKNYIINLINLYLTKECNELDSLRSNLPQKNDIKWDNCNWERKFLISTHVLGTDHANLFFHGWLHKNQVKNRNKHIESYPLIAVFDNKGAIKPCINNVFAFDSMKSASFNSFSVVHSTTRKLAKWGGDSFEEYVKLLISHGIDEEDAEIIALAEEENDNDYVLGENMGKIQFDMTKKHGECYVICADLSDQNKPRLLITLLLIVTSPEVISDMIELDRNSNIGCMDNINNILRELSNVSELSHINLSYQNKIINTFDNFSNLKKIKKFCVINTESSKAWDLRTFATMFISHLKCDNDVWDECNIATGELMRDDALTYYDGIVITGSHFNVSDRDIIPNPIPWFDSLCKFIQDAANIGAPKIYGGCFGCQIISCSLGGCVDKNPDLKFILKAETIVPLPLFNDLFISLSHGECVSILPPNSKLLASSSSCENELFCCGINNNILACQSHPEFDKVFCIDERIWPAVVETNNRLDEEAIVKSIESMDGFSRSDGSDYLMNIIKKFLHSN